LKHLFSPFRIKNIELKNRIVMPGLASFLFKNGGKVTDQAVEHYRQRAAGGPSMVIMEACAVSPEGIVSPNQARIDHDCFIEGLSRIAAVLKYEGAVPAIQIQHSGRQTSSKIIGQKPLAPSNLPCPTIRGAVEPLSINGIQKLVQKFADAALRARQADFDLIEIHGAHGYLINQFLSKFSNIREDRYGGDFKGRSCFAKEIVQAIKKRLGRDFPVSFKISAQEFVPDGLNVSESIQILQMLIDAGIDVVQVSAGNDATPEWIIQPMFMEKACLVESADRIKKELNIPVMTVGRINDPLIAREIIRTGKADLVCIGRGLLADPEMPRKAMENRLDEIRTCIACNTCIESIFREGHIQCLVNPVLGRELDMKILPTQNPKKIMIVGGGPGGLNAAWIAAKRGHEVHLFDTNAAHGGQLILGSIARHKKELLNLIQFFKRQTEKFGVSCHLNHEVSLKTIRQETPDVIILATGSHPYLPPIEGIEKKIVVPIDTALSDAHLTMGKTVVIGGGPTGCEVALHLSEQGCPVTIVEMLPEIGRRLETMTRKIFLQKFKTNRVQLLTGHTLSKVVDEGVLVTGKDDKSFLVAARHVVFAVGNRPHDPLYEKLVASGYETYKIGDCLKPRSIKEAIYESAVLSRSI